MKKNYLILFLFCGYCSSLYAQSDWLKNGNGISDHVAINEFLTIGGELYACGHHVNEQFASEPRMYKTTDGGENWELVGMSGLDIKTMNAVFEFNGSIFASGSMNASGGMQYGVYFSKDNGSSWLKNGNGISDHVAINEFLTIDGELYACGHHINEQFVSEPRMYKTTDGGENWEQVGMSGLDIKTMNAVFEFNGSIFASGSMNASGGMQYGVFKK